MTDYVEVESEIGVSKPIKASTGLKMVRNLLAVITGGANAPKIENGAFDDNTISGSKLLQGSIPNTKLENGMFSAGDKSFIGYGSPVGAICTSWTEALKFVLTISGTIRVKFNLISTSVSGYGYGYETVYAAIYKNDQQIGETYSTTTAIEVSADIAGWEYQDVLQIFVKGVSLNCYAVVSNFQICLDKYLESKVLSAAVITEPEFELPNP